MPVVVAPQHADVGSGTARAGELGPAAVILHIEPAGRGVVTNDLVDALAELRIRIRLKTCADAFVGCLERFPAVLAQVMSARRDTEVHVLAVADDRVHAE